MRNVQAGILSPESLPPEVTDTGPDLLPGADPIWGGFVTLSSCRQAGFSPSPLLFGEIAAYLGERGVTGEDRGRWIRLLKACDLEWLSQVAKRDRPKGKTPRKRSRG